MSGRDQVLERRTRLTVCCWCISGFVVAGDRQDEIMDTIEHAFGKWEAGDLRNTGKPGIGVQQAVARILELLRYEQLCE